jgi:hypothetical protein
MFLYLSRRLVNQNAVNDLNEMYCQVHLLYKDQYLGNIKYCMNIKNADGEQGSNNSFIMKQIEQAIQDFRQNGCE